MSEKTLDKLITTLKSEAIDAADKASKKIVEDAHTQAKKIVKVAEEKRKQILMDAEKEKEATLSKGKSALQQAARDLHITLQNSLLKLFGAVLEKEVHKVFTPDLLKSAVVKVIENIGSGIELKLSEDFEQALADHIHQHLKTSKDFVSITKADNMLNRLSIIKTDEGWSYHISPEEVAALLNTHLSGKWMNILKNEA
ncbi:hypothetical protein Q4Q34_14180 [Flavivirga abyssicola]|uniref:hypothetical protein n=1 Tax=Flavivirga abyssicola TaxID=3063533 RepID=UPI0026DEF30B|nr:hypothetical protein [Flavivirga sp. MEBiC07777]WVK12370.1 hypothetical protein Q4Q34_14180 [Flavivirga sp. MEBiC07777]